MRLARRDCDGWELAAFVAKIGQLALASERTEEIGRILSDDYRAEYLHIRGGRSAYINDTNRDMKLHAAGSRLDRTIRCEFHAKSRPIGPFQLYGSNIGGFSDALTHEFGGSDEFSRILGAYLGRVGSAVCRVRNIGVSVGEIGVRFGERRERLRLILKKTVKADVGNLLICAPSPTVRELVIHDLVHQIGDGNVGSCDDSYYHSDPQHSSLNLNADPLKLAKLFSYLCLCAAGRIAVAGCDRGWIRQGNDW